VANVNIVDHIEYCETGAGSGTRRFVECVRLSETFYQQLQAHPVSVDKASVMAIRNSSMALDLYMWLAYRLHSLESEKAISWAALKGQFGGGVSAMRNFKPLFNENLQLALGVYRTANVVTTPSGVLLRPSPPPVPQRTSPVWNSCYQSSPPRLRPAVGGVCLHPRLACAPRTARSTVITLA
jgi:Plasmid encoded RepA protein